MSLMKQRIRLVMSFVCIVLGLCITGCRTYVGSDSLEKTYWTQQHCLNRTSGYDIEHGMIVDVLDDIITIQFATRSYEKEELRRELSRRTGTKYYYYQPTSDSRLSYTVYFPLAFFCDMFYWTWDHKGEHPPGILYQIAYLPFVKLFFQPILLSPSSFLFSDSSHYEEKSEEEWDTPTVLKIELQNRFVPSFVKDFSQAVVTVSQGNKTLSKKLSWDGKLSFSLSEFHQTMVDPDQNLSFRIHYPDWEMAWMLEAPSILDPSTVRDWNIYTDNRYDCLTRILALNRLETVLGKEEYQKRFQEFFNKKEVHGHHVAPEMKIIPEQ